jgi:hypothetical protein
VQPPIPDVTAPPNMLADHEQDELELANLTGVHGIVDKKPATPAAPGAPEAPAPAQSTAKQMHQTPTQAVKLAAALNDLKHHPQKPVNDQPVVVVHRHDYLRNIAIFFGFTLGGILFAAVILDLILDAEILDLGVRPLTNFF